MPQFSVNRTTLPRTLRIAVIFLVGFIALSHIGRAFETDEVISLWWPPAGLSLALILFFGWRYAPLMLLGYVLDGLLSDTYGLPWSTYIIFNGIVSGIYAIGGTAGRRFLSIDDEPLTTARDIFGFISVGMLTPLLAAMLAIPVLIVQGAYLWPDYASSVASFWVGDVIGILFIVPAKAGVDGSIQETTGPTHKLPTY